MNIQFEDEYAWINENEKFIDLSHVLVNATEALTENYPLHYIGAMKLYNENIEQFHFITQRDTTYHWEDLEMDIERSKSHEVQKNSAAHDIQAIDKFKKFVAGQIEKGSDGIAEKNIEKSRRFLRRTEVFEDIEIFKFDLFSFDSISKNVLWHLVSHFIFVTNHSKNSQDPAHLTSQIILNKALGIDYVWSIDEAIKSDFETYISYFKKDHPVYFFDRLEMFVEYMLGLFIKQITRTQRMLSNQNLYSRLTKFVTDYNNDCRNEKKIPGYALPLLKELILVEEFPREEVIDFIANHSTRGKPISASTRTKLLKHLSEIKLISSKTSKGNIRLNIQSLLNTTESP